MKNILIALCLLLSIKAHAGFITLDTENTQYNENDNVYLSLTAESLHEDTATLEVDIIFDNTLLSFNDFTFDAAVIAPPFPAFGALFTDIAVKHDNVLSIAIWWFDASEVPLPAFKLGIADFTALSDFSATFDISAVRQFDINDTELVTSVHEPATWLLLAMCCYITLYRRLIHQNKAC
ncbi:hypothetical protein [Thalassotalea sediminis]|uniref:hypothetical protein n=1 Tax=Thalassotalea sediminis TaxID=1759089 RepID=UPI0025732440|nr:hypothetical protein [Thalassotalea sediminis]